LFALLLGLAWPAQAANPTGAPTSQPSTPTSQPSAATSRPSAATKGAASESSELMLYEEMPVVVTAAKHEQKTQQAAASVSVVTAEEIELYGYRSLGDILRTQRGFYIFNDGLNQFLGVRGFLRGEEWNARILVLVDGRPTREPIFGQTHLDQGMVVPVEVIKQVEIIRGPGSALYGANAVFAVINIITRSGSDVNNWAEVRAQGGNEETGRGETILGHKFANGLDFLMGGSRFYSQGDRDISYPGVDDAAHNYGHIRDNDSEMSGDFFSKVTYGEFTLEADYDKRVKDNSTATYLALWTDPGRMMERRDDISLRWDHPVCEGQSLHASAFYSQYAYDQYWGQDDAHGHPYTYTSTDHSNWSGQNVYYDWQVSKSNRLILGTEEMETFRSRQNDWDDLNGTVLNVDPGLNSEAGYVQDEQTVTKWLTLVGGLRVDKIQRFDPLLDPRLAAIITLTKADTIKLLYGRAFRAPNLYEMYYSSPGANVPNRNLKPEISDTYEATWDHDFGKGLHTETGCYFWRMYDTLGDGVKDDALQTQNMGKSWAMGLEGEVEKRWENGARVRFSGNFGRTVDEHDQRLPLSPDVLLSMAGAVPVSFINKRTFLAVETQMVGPMLSDTGQSTNPTYLTNVVLTSKKVWKGLDVQVGVYNIFSNSALEPRASPWNQYQTQLRAPGVLGMITLTYRF
jgi:iron complex outermembrane receptor protein